VGAGDGCLLLDTKDIVDQAKISGRDKLSSAALAELHASYRELIALGYEENPGLDGQGDRRSVKRTKAQNLLLRLDEREDEVLRLAHDFRAPFDNNLCERDLRMVKLQQKISGCWRTPRARRAVLGDPLLPLHRPQARPAPGRRVCQLAAGRPCLPQAAGP
jgi:transposase